MKVNLAGYAAMTACVAGLVLAFATICAAQKPASSSSGAAAKPAATSAPADDFPAGAGRAEFLRICSQCHGPERVIGHGKDADGWSATIDEMIQNGAEGSDQDFGAIIHYLTEHFGPAPAKVNVNKASVMDLRNWLGLPASQAAAIVRHREHEGAIQSLGELEKLPGVDAKLIEAHKEHLTF